MDEGRNLGARTALRITTGVTATGACPSSGRESKDAVLTMDWRFCWRLGADGRDIRRNGRYVERCWRASTEGLGWRSSPEEGKAIMPDGDDDTEESPVGGGCE